MSEPPANINSRIKNMRSMEPQQRLEAVAAATDLGADDRRNLSGENALPIETANGMIENVVGKFELPLGVATNFLINGRDFLIPMAVEEPSVVAAASFMAKLARSSGGFTASSTPPIMRSQIQILDIPDPFEAKERILARREDLITAANACDEVLVNLGGGCVDIEVHIYDTTPVGPLVVLHLLVDVRDAMGANTVNTMAEIVAPLASKIAGGRARLRILSNLADRRLAKAQVTIPFEMLSTEELDGRDVAVGVIEAYALAEVDPYRAATHNKGIMNGIDPILVATGNDWRAIEAGAHAFAARNGTYSPLSKWEMNEGSYLSGEIELPLAVGIVGGATKTHPTAQAALRLMGVQSANELGEVIACVGLAQNLAALRALATEGIQRGHMALHARNIAIMAGAKGDNIDRIARALSAGGNVSVKRAKQLLDE